MRFIACQKSWNGGLPGRTRAAKNFEAYGMHVGRAREFCQRDAGIPAFLADQRQDGYQPFPGAGGQQNNFAIGLKHLQIGGDPLGTVKRRASRLVAQLLPSVSQKVNYLAPPV